MKKKIVIFIIIAALIGGGFYLFNSQRSPKVEVVKITAVESGDIQTWLSTDALIKSKNTKDYFGTAGLTVSKVYVEVGDTVKSGDVLLDYDLEDLAMAVEQAQIQYDNAVLNKRELVAQNKKIIENIEDMDSEMLRLDGSSNPQDIARLQTLIQQRNNMDTISDEKFLLMDNSIAMAQLGLESALNRFNKVKDGLVADMDGVVTALNATEDTALSPAAPSVVLQDLNNLKGVISLGKYDAVKIKLGQVSIVKNAGKTYDAVLSFINPAASKGMGMTSTDALLEVEVDIKNPDNSLKVDFKVDVEILTGEVKKALRLPVECIYYDKDDNSFVYRLSDGKLSLVPVKLGLQSDTLAEVLEGLSEGDKVVMNPTSNLTDGMAAMEEGAAQ